ncbi:hypothetical protein SISSUDRAFT_1039652 [Sistotremastrum suecicum HHB10207 ss-3]|uniref:Histone H1 n=1 Tax=Sistotremastrum suecicum HHB10207 ss-3 TaxID=1314776 RepID=A0A166II28_9AGAM|nr:hypothetical protein SISSUDRAFT_1039652 [Sistotremastrum suecicum HHB10207 ss-3]
MQSSTPATPPVSSESSLKRTYLTLLPPFQLIDLLLAIDADRSNPIFPPNLEEVVKRIQEYRRTHEQPGATAYPYPPPPAPLHTYPHYPYYRPPGPGPGAPPAVPGASPDHAPLFTSTPLQRIAPPPDPRGHDDMPSYEEMIVEALTEMNDPEGIPPKVLFARMESRYPLQTNFRPSASQALQKAFKRGRLYKSSQGKYSLNPNWEGGTTSRRTTRRPQHTPAFSSNPTHHLALSGQVPVLSTHQTVWNAETSASSVRSAIEMGESLGYGKTTESHTSEGTKGGTETDKSPLPRRSSMENGVRDRSALKSSLSQLADLLRQFSQSRNAANAQS